MILFPALDLLGGQCVRLTHGERAQATIYNPDPVEQARLFLQQGARALHIVDLDAAFDGQSENAPVVERIVHEAKKHNAFVQLGGGLRSNKAIERWLEAGVDRVVIATLALENLPLALKLCEQWHKRIAIALDLREGKMATRGWLVEHDLDVRSWLAPFLEPERIISAVVVTDITRDGTLAGSNNEMTFQFARTLFARTLPCHIIASGGIASLEDLSVLARAGIVDGAICGRALYEGRFSCEEALASIEKASAETSASKDKHTG